MNHAKCLLMTFCWSCLVVFPAAAQGPRISSDNASQVRAVAETAKSADRMILGPQRGELTIYGWTKSLEIVDDTHFRMLRNINDDFMPVDLAWSQDGKFLTWNERNSKSYFVLDVQSGKTIDIDMGDHPGNAAFSPDGKLLAIGKTFWDPNAEGVGLSAVVLFDVSGKLIKTLEGSRPGGLRPVFSPDGKTLAVGNRNYETKLFDLETGKLLVTLPKQMTQEIAFSPNGKTLATGYVDGTVALWDVADGKLLHSANSECSEVYSVAWNPEGDVLATSGLNGKIILWDAKTFKKLATFDAPMWVIQVRFTADGTRLLTSSSSESTAKRDRKIVTYSILPKE